MLEELLKEIVEIIEFRKKHRKENGNCWCISRKYSSARLKRLRLLLNEIIKKEERNNE